MIFEAGGRRKTLLGMVHLSPLPGTPFYEPDSFPSLVDRAVTSAVTLESAGFDGCLVQTVDRVYSVADEADPARIAAMTIVVREVVRATSHGFKVGVQIMYNAVRASLAVAKVAEADFIRASAVVGASVSAHGLVQANPEEVSRYRSAIAASDVAMVADVGSMHFRWLGGDRGVGEVAVLAHRAGADGVAVSNPDEAALAAALREIRGAAPQLPVILAGGTTHGNAGRLLALADGAFVGGCLERQGWGGAIDSELARNYVARVRAGAG
ncbi:MULTISPECIES: BtpA/SgcQ family protein [unclassified Phenylobacterium]|uniref:BtpA/SgcQ family protein n=1 Tax=unclassified Phenylobacterium TaxID=2640670 RepID=UPI000AE171FD|nr:MULTISPECIES: BtpA/SgcQ family protein [unclassified Phenylobacterium]